VVVFQPTQALQVSYFSNRNKVLCSSQDTIETLRRKLAFKNQLLSIGGGDHYHHYLIL
jgi:hypothetical protein